MRPLCGTNGGHAAHKRHNEPICIPCADAKKDYIRSLRILNDHTREVHVPAVLLGALLRSHPDALRQAVAELGQKTVDAARIVSVNVEQSKRVTP